MKPTFGLRYILFFSSILTAQVVHAQTSTWNGITGNWSDAGVWSGGTPADGADNTANFTGVNITAGQIITLDTDRIIGNITFTDATTPSNDLTISGAGILTLDRTDSIAPIINVTQSGRTLTISSQISGNDGFTKNGAGTLLLSNSSNDFFGDISINSGTLNFTTIGSVNTGQNFVFTGDSTLLLANALNGYVGGNIAVNSGVTALMSASTGNSQTYASATSGSNTSVIQWTGNGGSTLSIDDLSAYTGILRTGSGSSSTPTFKIGNLTDAIGYGNLQFGGTNNTTATFELYNMAGAFTMSNRSIEIISGSATATPTLVNNQANSANTWTINTDLINSSTGTKTLTLGGTNTGINTFAGNITNGSGTIALSKSGTGTWALGGTNTYSGDTNLTAASGLMIFQGSQSLSANTTLKFAQSSSAVTSVRFLDDGSGTINFNRPIEFGGTNTSQSLNIFVGNNNTINGGNSSGTTTGSTIQVGNITFTSTATDTASTTINATSTNGYRLQTGTITLNNLATRTAGQTTVTVLNPTSANMTVGAITMATGNTGIANDGVPVLRLDGTSLDNYVTGAISNASDFATGQALSLQKQNTSIWTLQGTNTYTGTTTVSGGRLLLSSTGSLASGSAVTVSGGAIGGTGTVNGTLTLSSVGGIDLLNGSVGQFNINNTLSSTGVAGANNLYLDLANGGSSVDKIVASGAFSMTNSGAVVVNLNQIGGTATRLNAGTYDILTAASGINSADFRLATTKAFGQTFALSNPDGTTLRLTTTQVTASAGNVTLSGSSPDWTVGSNFSGSAVPDYESNVTINSAIGTGGTLSASQNINSLIYGTSATANTTISGGTAASGVASNMLVIEARGVNGNTAGDGITLNNTSGTHTIAANIGIARSQTWTIAGSTGGLTVSGVISDFGGGFGLTKAGTGTLTLTGANTYSGGNTITGGVLSVNSSSVGSVANGPLALSGGGRLTVTSTNVTSSSQVTIGTGGGSIAVNGNNNFTTTGKLTGSGSLTKAFVTGSGTQTLSFNGIDNDFTGALIIDNSNTSGISNVVNFSSLGDASGAGNLVFYRGASGSATGTFNYNAGAVRDLILNHRQIAIDTPTAMTATLSNSSTSYGITVNTNLVATGAGAKTLVLSSASGPTNTFAGNITNGSDGGTVAITKSSTGNWALTSANNTFTGAITLSSTNTSAGTLTYASAGGANAITFSQTSGSAVLSYAGSGQTMSGAITASALTTGTITFDSSGSGAVNYSNTADMGNSGGTNVKNLVLSGANTGNNILAAGWTNNGTGAATITKSGAGRWTLAGTNNYTGKTTVNAGTLQFAKMASLYNSTSSSWTAANINVKSGATLAVNVDSAGTAGFDSGNLNTLLGNISAAGAATSGLQNGASIGIDTSTATGGIFTQGNAIANSTGSFGGRIGLTKLGAGTLILDKTNTYTGATKVNAGTLQVNGSISRSSLTTVASGATIGGSGTIGALTVSAGGFINPGNSPDTLDIVGAYIQAGTYNAEITANTVGNGTTGYDQISVAGTVNITGGSLITAFSGGGYAANNMLFILINDGTDAITGTYSGYADGATVATYDGFNWNISYFGDSGTNSFTGGNDIVLMAQAIPEPKAALLGIIGLLLILRRRRQ